MALRKYKNLYIFRNKINELLHLSFPEDDIKEIDLKWTGENMEAAQVFFTSGRLKGFTGAIHNYTMHIDIPEDRLRDLPYFQNHFNFWFEEVHTWIKSEGKRIRIYPRDRNDYLDNEIDLVRRAHYFVIVLQITLAWVKRNIESN